MKITSKSFYCENFFYEKYNFYTKTSGSQLIGLRY